MYSNVSEDLVSFVYLAGSKSLDKLVYSPEAMEFIRNSTPEKKEFYFYILGCFQGSDEFYKNQAYLELGRLNNQKSMEDLEVELKRLFNHPALVTYHPNLDAYTINFFTHSQLIKNINPQISTIALSPIDLLGQLRPQYLSLEFIQIPASVLTNFIDTGNLQFTEYFATIDGVRYTQTHNLAPVFKDVVTQLTPIINVSKEYIFNSQYNTTEIDSEFLSKVTLEQQKDTNYFRLRYKSRPASYMLCRPLTSKTIVTATTCKCTIF